MVADCREGTMKLIMSLGRLIPKYAGRCAVVRCVDVVLKTRQRWQKESLHFYFTMRSTKTTCPNTEQLILEEAL